MPNTLCTTFLNIGIDHAHQSAATLGCLTAKVPNATIFPKLNHEWLLTTNIQDLFPQDLCFLGSTLIVDPQTHHQILSAEGIFSQGKVVAAGIH